MKKPNYTTYTVIIELYDAVCVEVDCYWVEEIEHHPFGDTTAAEDLSHWDEEVHADINGDEVELSPELYKLALAMAEKKRTGKTNNAFLEGLV